MKTNIPNVLRNNSTVFNFIIIVIKKGWWDKFFPGWRLNSGEKSFPGLANVARCMKFPSSAWISSWLSLYLPNVLFLVSCHVICLLAGIEQIRFKFVHQIWHHLGIDSSKLCPWTIFKRLHMILLWQADKEIDTITFIVFRRHLS